MCVRDYGENITSSVAAQLRELRRLNGWTLRETAAAADLHPSTVHLIEQGKRGVTLATAARLAQAFDVNLSDLVAVAERNA